MIDLSDGLGGDARHLAESGRVGLRINAAALPLAAGVAEVAAAAGRDPVELAARQRRGLRASCRRPPRAARAGGAGAVREAEGIALTEIGEVVAGGGVEIRLPGGGLLEAEGFDQFA